VLSLVGGDAETAVGVGVTLSTGNGTLLKSAADRETITHAVTGLNDDTTWTFSVFTLHAYRGSGGGTCTPAGAEGK
jgi:hypothetical protein